MLARNMDANFSSFLADPFGAATIAVGQSFKGAGPLVVALV
jgi:hypothetical protein